VNGPVLSEKAPNLGPPKTPKTLRDHISDARRARLAAPKNPKTLSEASERGLVAVWAATFGYVAIHDPLAGEWHDVQTKEAPGWALREASTRKTLYRGGDRRAYSYNAREMGELWEAERPPMEEGIREEYGIDAEDQKEDYE